jgi:hypothetical protein
LSLSKNLSIFLKVFFLEKDIEIYSENRQSKQQKTFVCLCVYNFKVKS